MLQKCSYVTVSFVTVREKKAVTFTEKEKPKLGVTFLSCRVYCFETSTGGNRAMHDPVECFLLYTSVPVTPLFSDLSRLTERLMEKDWMQNIQAQFLNAALALFIFCVSAPACPPTTVVSIDRRVMPLSVHGTHSSVAS